MLKKFFRATITALILFAPQSFAEVSGEPCRSIVDGDPAQALAVIARGEFATGCDAFYEAAYYHQIDVLRALAAVPKILDEAKKSSRPLIATLSRSILEVGSEKAPLETLTFLLDLDFPVNRTPDAADSPLHIAASHGYVLAAKYLVAHGADVNAPNEIGSTPLHEATAAAAIGRSGVDQKSRRLMLTLLLTSGAKVGVLNRCHQSPLDQARYNLTHRGSNISKKEMATVLTLLQTAARKQSYVRPKVPQLKPDFPECPAN